MDGGDAFANSHRTELPSNYLMTDFDYIFGVQTFGVNSENSFFSEYAVRKNKVAFVAMFDRKNTRHAMKYGNTKPIYLSLCKSVSKDQLLPCRFFYVIGQKAPFTFIEIDINNGNVINETELNNWTEIYKTLGLTDLRKQLTNWLEKSTETIF